MSFLAQPTKAGTYRIKVYDSDKDRYWKYIPDRDRWVQLTAIDESTKPSSIQFKVDTLFDVSTNILLKSFL